MPFKRPRFNGKFVFNDARYSEFKMALELVARKTMSGNKPLSGAIKISVTVTRNLNPTARAKIDFDSGYAERNFVLKAGKVLKKAVNGGAQ